MNALIDGRQSHWFGPLMIAAGLLAIGAGVWSVIMSSQSGWFQGVLGGVFPAVLGGLFVIGGQMLSSRRGGVFVGPDGVMLQGDGDDDRLQVPMADIVTVHVFELVERWGEEAHPKWICEATLATGGRLLLGESTDERGLRHYAHRFTTAAELPPPSDDEPGPELAQRRVTGQRRIHVTQPTENIVKSLDSLIVGVGSRGRLARTLWVSALAMLLVGILLLVDLPNNDVMGFLFGPLLTAIGLSLFILQACKAQLVEHIRFFDGEMGHGYEAFGVRWGWQTLPLVPGAYVRIRQRGLLGANLELVSGGRIRHLIGGVHATTRVNHSDLRWLAGEVEVRLESAMPDVPLETGESDG